MKSKLNPRVIEIQCLDDFELQITFSNGEIGIYSVIPLLNFGVFSELADVMYFKMAKVVNGTVGWPNEQDICPDTLYLESRKVCPTR